MSAAAGSLPSTTRIGFIGGGAMATAIAQGIGRAKVAEWSQMAISDIHTTSPPLKELAELGVQVTEENRAVAAGADILFLCTKPDVVLPALQPLLPSLRPSTLLISIAAGLTLESLEGGLPAGTRVVRVMPNTPALIGVSASAYSLGRSCKEEDAKIVQVLLTSIGTAVRLPEKDLNAVTGLSGSGPAYVFMFIEALADGGVRSGLTRAVAHQLAVQTVIGSAQLVQQSGKHPGQLKDQVARSDVRKDPGGTTIAGIHALEDGSFRSTIMDAVYAATLRAKELGEATKQIKSKL